VTLGSATQRKNKYEYTMLFDEKPLLPNQRSQVRRRYKQNLAVWIEWLFLCIASTSTSSAQVGQWLWVQQYREKQILNYLVIG
jgi:hypothetical protein